MIKKLLNKIISRYKFVRGDINLNNRTGMLHRSWGHIFSNHIMGDYVEFGVYKGASLAESVYQYRQFYNWLILQKKSDEQWRQEVSKKSELNEKVFFHGLDTFDGMPENNEQNFIFKKDTFKSNYNEVKKRFKNFDEKILLYKGLFSDNKEAFVRNMDNRKISIANIDCDLYQSTMDAFNMIENFLQIGSIVLLDDYNSFNADNNKGQRKALIEYKSQTSFIFEPFFSYMFTGQAFLIVQKK